MLNVKPQLKAFRVIIGLNEVEHVYFVRAENMRRAKMIVWNNAANPPWQAILDILRARFRSGGPFYARGPGVSVSVTPTKERCTKEPMLRYSFNTATGEMNLASA